MNKNIGLVLAVLAMTFLLAGCPSKPVSETTPRADAAAGAGAESAGLASRDPSAALNDPSSPLYQRVIYFDYDRTDILPQFVEVLRAHGTYLATNPSTKLMLEGHTDERGTREYNLALGDQRADAVRRFLMAEGARADQISTLSYGEERPADHGHGESSWALNRRVELVY